MKIFFIIATATLATLVCGEVYRLTLQGQNQTKILTAHIESIRASIPVASFTIYSNQEQQYQGNSNGLNYNYSIPEQQQSYSASVPLEKQTDLAPASATTTILQTHSSPAPAQLQSSSLPLIQQKSIHATSLAPEQHQTISDPALLAAPLQQQQTFAGQGKNGALPEQEQQTLGAVESNAMISTGTSTYQAPVQIKQRSATIIQYQSNIKPTSGPVQQQTYTAPALFAAPLQQQQQQSFAGQGKNAALTEQEQQTFDAVDSNALINTGISTYQAPVQIQQRSAAVTQQQSDIIPTSGPVQQQTYSDSALLAAPLQQQQTFTGQGKNVPLTEQEQQTLGAVESNALISTDTSTFQAPVQIQQRSATITQQQSNIIPTSGPVQQQTYFDPALFAAPLQQQQTFAGQGKSVPLTEQEQQTLDAVDSNGLINTGISTYQAPVQIQQRSAAVTQQQSNIIPTSGPVRQQTHSAPALFAAPLQQQQQQSFAGQGENAALTEQEQQTFDAVDSNALINTGISTYQAPVQIQQRSAAVTQQQSDIIPTSGPVQQQIYSDSALLAAPLQQQQTFTGQGKSVPLTEQEQQTLGAVESNALISTGTSTFQAPVQIQQRSATITQQQSNIISTSGQQQTYSAPVHTEVQNNSLLSTQQFHSTPAQQTYSAPVPSPEQQFTSAHVPMQQTYTLQRYLSPMQQQFYSTMELAPVQQKPYSAPVAIQQQTIPTPTPIQRQTLAVPETNIAVTKQQQQTFDDVVPYQPSIQTQQQYSTPVQIQQESILSYSNSVKSGSHNYQSAAPVQQEYIAASTPIQQLRSDRSPDPFQVQQTYSAPAYTPIQQLYSAPPFVPVLPQKQQIDTSTSTIETFSTSAPTAKKAEYFTRTPQVIAFPTPSSAQTILAAPTPTSAIDTVYGENGGYVYQK